MKTKNVLIATSAAAVLASAVAGGIAVQAAPARIAAKPAVQTARVLVTDKGYQPASITLKKGIPAKITFLRKSDTTCANSIEMPAYKISKALPLNKPVTIAFTPTKTGKVPFACSMDMVRGSIVVK